MRLIGSSTTLRASHGARVGVGGGRRVTSGQQSEDHPHAPRHRVPWQNNVASFALATLHLAAYNFPTTKSWLTAKVRRLNVLPGQRR